MVEAVSVNSSALGVTVSVADIGYYLLSHRDGGVLDWGVVDVATKEYVKPDQGEKGSRELFKPFVVVKSDPSYLIDSLLDLFRIFSIYNSGQAAFPPGYDLSPLLRMRITDSFNDRLFFKLEILVNLIANRGVRDSRYSQSIQRFCGTDSVNLNLCLLLNGIKSSTTVDFDKLNGIKDSILRGLVDGLPYLPISSYSNVYDLISSLITKPESWLVDEKPGPGFFTLDGVDFWYGRQLSFGWLPSEYRTMCIEVSIRKALGIRSSELEGLDVELNEVIKASELVFAGIPSEVDAKLLLEFALGIRSHSIFSSKGVAKGFECERGGKAVYETLSTMDLMASSKIAVMHWSEILAGGSELIEQLIGLFGSVEADIEALYFLASGNGSSLETANLMLASWIESKAIPQENIHGVIQVVKMHQEFILAALAMMEKKAGVVLQ